MVVPPVAHLHGGHMGDAMAELTQLERTPCFKT